MKKYLSSCIDGINIITFTLFISTLLWYFCLLINQPILYMLPLYTSILLILSFFSNTYIHKFFIFATAHLATGAVILALPFESYEKIIVMLVFIMICFIDFNVWRDLTKVYVISLPMPMVILFFITSLHGLSGLSDFLADTSYYFGTLFILLTLLRMFFNNMLDYNNGIAEKKYFPIRSIINQNTILVMIFSSFMLIVTLFFRSKVLENFFSKLFTYLLNAGKQFLTFLFRLFHFSNSDEVVDKTSPESSVSLLDMTPKKVNPIVEFILNFLQIAIEFLICFGFLFIVIYGIYSFLKHYWNRNTFTQKEDLEYKVIETKEKIKKNSSFNPNAFQGKTINDKIRIYYRKKIDRMTKKGYTLQLNHTPNERASDLNEQKNINIDNLTQYYNRARYSNEHLTKEELEAVIKKK